MKASSTSLDGKRVVVIGGASGIGYGVAAAALDEGARVVVASSREANVQAAAERLGGEASGSVVDVSDEASVARFFEQLGPFDHLAFTAGDWGMSRGAPARELDLTAAQAAFTVRFWGALAVVKHGCRTIAEDGSITLTGGMLAHRPMKGAPLSTVVTGAIEHLTRALAVDLAPVRVNAVCPGLVLTDRTRLIPEERRRAMTARLPVSRVAEPAEAAQAYLYLMRGGYTTGQVLRVDGGGSLV
ncbi:MAG: SDR family oxidoreductase [Caulobacteraceae bacterium]|nr:SDR family oxidoreductase [Caulobacteraceae bacterium]